MVVLVKSFIVLIRKQKTFITNSSCNVTFHYISVCILWYCKVISYLSFQKIIILKQHGERKTFENCVRYTLSCKEPKAITA